MLEGEATINERAAPFALTLPTVSRHLRVLGRVWIDPRHFARCMGPAGFRCHRLEFTSPWANDGPSAGVETLISIELRERASITTQRFVQRSFRNSTRRDAHAGGWGSSIDTLANDIMCELARLRRASPSCRHFAHHPRIHTMACLDGFVAPVASSQRERYRDHVLDAVPRFREFGARRIVETWDDDVPAGNTSHE